jgi:N-methylhydantoinase A
LSITLSSEVSPEVREYERFTTATANAYVQPLMARYLKRLGDEFARGGLNAPLFLMTSGGGLTTLETAIRFPVRLVESGPAGGAILAGRIAGECGLDNVVSFDMGGTTAKICIIEGQRPQTARSFEFGRTARFLKGSGLTVRIPVIEMVEIGAGGGSIARLDEMGQIAIGPESAGSDPGPACYDLGGEAPTVTDADVALGRIDPDRFAGGKLRLSADRAGAAIARGIAEPLELAGAMAAYGVAEMVDENMANAARVHAIERGKVIGGYALIAFGGAAPLHVCRLADKLGIDRIVVPTHAGVGSAIGFLRAPVAYEVVRSRYMRLGAFDHGLANDVLGAMHKEAMSVVRAGAPEDELVESRSAFMRYVGQGHEIVAPLPNRPLDDDDAALLQAAFDREYESQFSRTIPDAEVEILSWALTISAVQSPPVPVGECRQQPVPEQTGRRTVFDPEGGQDVDVPVFAREALAPGAHFGGPALITEDETSTYVAADFAASVLANGYILLERQIGANGEKGEDSA